MGKGRILVDQSRGHGQMACHVLGVLLAQRLELVAGSTVQVASGDLVGNLRLVDTRTRVRGLHRTFPSCTASLGEGT